MVGRLMTATVPLFDRRVPAPLLDLLKPGGKLNEITRLAKEDSDRGLDLQLRANPKHGGQGQVTLYVGLTKAFDLYLDKRGRIKVTPQKYGPADRARQHGWSAWSEPGSIDADAFLAWTNEMIDASRDASAGKIDQEGMVQEMVSRGVSDRYCVIDRESVFAFKSTPDRIAGLEKIRRPLHEASQALIATGKDWARHGGKTSTKLDALGVDTDGRVLVIEVKPGEMTSTLVWTPFQVATYMAIFRAWRDATAAAAEMLNGMIRQRQQLGLLEDGPWHVPDKFELVPVIAVGLPVKSPKAVERMELVRDEVLKKDRDLLANLTFWRVPESGPPEACRLDELRR